MGRSETGSQTSLLQGRNVDAPQRTRMEGRGPVQRQIDQTMRMQSALVTSDDDDAKRQAMVGMARGTDARISFRAGWCYDCVLLYILCN